MTVPTTAVFTGPYYPNGVTVEYPFGFKANSDTEVAVFYVEDDGTETIIPSANYTVALSTNDNAPGGTVTTAGPLPDSAGKPLYVGLDPEFTQNTKFEDEGAFNQSILNPTFDAGALRSIWLRSRMQRAILAPFGEPGWIFPTAAVRASRFLSFDANGEIVLSQGTGADLGLREDLGGATGAQFVNFSADRRMDEALQEERTRVNVLRHIPYAQHARIKAGLVPTIDIEPYLQLALDEVLATRTGMSDSAYGFNNPTSRDEYGCDTLYFPKGRYPMAVGFAAMVQAFGVTIMGDGAYQSIVELHADDQHMFVLDAYNHFKVIGMTFRHIAQSDDPLDWTGDLFVCNGVGGGRQLKFFDSASLGFNWFQRYPDGNVVNNDTLQIEGSDVYWCNEIAYARNSQALINKWEANTFYGHGNGLNHSGSGYTSMKDINAVINGALVIPYGQAGLGGSSNQYLLENVKQEPYAIGLPGGLSRTALIRAAGDLSQIKAAFTLINVGLTSGVNFDPAYEQISLTSNMHISWKGGGLKPTARIVTHPTNRINNAVFNGAAGLFMEDLLEAPLASQIARGSVATGQQTYPAVVYEGNDIVPSLFCGAKTGELSTSGPPDMGKARKRQAMGHPSLRYPLLTAGAAATQSILFHGFVQSIDDLEIHLRDKGAAELVIEISTDNFATTTQTLYVPAGTATQGRVVKASDPYVASKTYDWPSLATGAQQSTTLTVRGAQLGDRVAVSLSVALAGTRIWAEVTAANTVTIYHRNDTGGAVDLESATLTAEVTPDRARCICGVRTSVGLYVRYSGPLAVGFTLADYTGR